jgi:hypothetical protein
MTTEFESELERLFADTDTELPDEEFTARLMAELHKPRRRERWIWSAACAVALALSWALFPTLDPVLRVVAGYPGELLDVVTKALVALSGSPLTYVYGTALAGYLLHHLVRRFHILFF